MLTVMTAVLIIDFALKLWATAHLPYLHETTGVFGVGFFLVFNRRPSYDIGQVALTQTMLVALKFLTLGYLGFRLRGWWRGVGLGLVLGGAAANISNWIVTRAVVDFLVMPWATVNPADLSILLGTAVIFAGWAVRGLGLIRHQPAAVGRQPIQRLRSTLAFSAARLKRGIGVAKVPHTPVLRSALQLVPEGHRASRHESEHGSAVAARAGGRLLYSNRSGLAVSEVGSVNSKVDSATQS
jgi:lipoprotein signal peptidase